MYLFYLEVYYNCTSQQVQNDVVDAPGFVVVEEHYIFSVHFDHSTTLTFFFTPFVKPVL